MATITYNDRLELRGSLAELLAILRALHVAGYARECEVTIALAIQAQQQQTTAQMSEQLATISEPAKSERQRGKSSWISRSKAPDVEVDLLAFIRRYGGIDPTKTSPDIQGELEALRPRESGTTRIINKNSRYSLRAMAELAAEAGFIRESGSEQELLDAITRAIAGEKVYSRYKGDYSEELSELLERQAVTLTPELAGAMLMGNPN